MLLRHRKGLGLKLSFALVNSTEFTQLSVTASAEASTGLSSHVPDPPLLKHDGVSSNEVIRCSGIMPVNITHVPLQHTYRYRLKMILMSENVWWCTQNISHLVGRSYLIESSNWHGIINISETVRVIQSLNGRNILNVCLPFMQIVMQRTHIIIRRQHYHSF